VRNRLVRLNSDGTEDTGFYTNLGTGFDDLVRSISIQSDGKILIGGAFTDFDGSTRNRLVRLNSDGTEDTGFYTNLGTGFDATIWSISIQSDGKILVGGEFEDFDGNTRNRLVRLNSDGTEDTGFYTNLGTGFNNPVLSIKVQLNTKILVCGSFNGFDANVRNYLVRLNSDGTEDTGFYTNLGTGFDIPVYSLEIQPDGLILVGGDFNDFDGNVRNYLVRLNSDGTEDTGFYANLGDGFDNRVWSIKVQLDAKILVGGGFTDLDGNTRNRLVRLNSDGTEDTGFYNNLGLGFNNDIYSLELQSDEKILVGGGFTAFDGNTRNRLVRLSELEESKIEIKSDIIEIGMSQSITTFSGQLSFTGATISGLPASDAIGFYEAEYGFNNFPYDGKTFSFKKGNDGPYFKTISPDWSELNPVSIKSIIIDGGTNSNNRFFLVSDEWIESSLIIGGKDNEINVQTSDSSLSSPRNMMIQNSDDSYIECSGTTYNNVIINSNNSEISGSSYSNIIGAIGATISNGTNTTIIGVDNIIATQSNTVYMPNVKVVNSISIDEVINLKPLSATPSNPIEGTIFYRQSVGIRFYDGANWRTIDFT
jgi:uncharacterized delta-60 repeat protein